MVTKCSNSQSFGRQNVSASARTTAWTHQWLQHTIPGQEDTKTDAKGMLRPLGLNTRGQKHKQESGC